MATSFFANFSIWLSNLYPFRERSVAQAWLLSGNHGYQEA